ncbi:NADPH-dependent F420 reductase [Caballeronia sordidicola]|uniref:NADPH-dependent F420 reductase n=1 Tax=Caballeronia sordidicola TaxID=196367 RepID=UPI00094CE8CB|nr:NADPH-dependent F420 reductase [Caballeronia sordidicola]
MSYAIIGAGAVGQALAKMFARKHVEVVLSSRRSPDALTPIAKAIGSTIIPKSMRDAVKADVVFLAIPFGTQNEVAKAAESWQGKIVVDVTNAYGVSPEELGNLPSSVVVSRAFPGATLVKAFNHLSAEILAEDPSVEGGRRVVFISSDNDDAAGQVGTVVEELGFAPVKLGRLAEGGLLVQARGKTWAPLIFQDLFKGNSNV